MKTKRSFDARSLNHHVLEVMRQRAVAAIEQGWKANQVAEILGLNRRTVFRWVADYRSGGMDALRAKPIPGRPKGKKKE